MVYYICEWRWSIFGSHLSKLDASNLLLFQLYTDIAYNIQKETWREDSDYEDLYDKAVNSADDNCFFLVYDKDVLIGINGVDVYDEYPEDIWLDWFTILPNYRQKGYGKKIL